MPRDYEDDDLEEVEEIEEVEEVEEVEELDDDFDDIPERRKGPGFFARMLQKIGGEPQRPGEQDVVRSPIILWLAGGSVIVGLLAMVLYFMIVKKSAEKQYEFAKVEMDGGKFAQAIELYDSFLKDNPDHELTPQAMIDKGKCRIEKEISGADPNVGPGLKALEDFIKSRRDQPDFKDHKSDIRSWARKITLKAAEKAERTKKQETLDISVKSQALLSRFAPEGGFSKELLDSIRLKQQSAARAILKSETSTGTIENIKQLISDGRPLDALRARRTLVQKYEMLAEDKEIKSLLTEIKAAEQATVTIDNTPRDPITEDRQKPVKQLVLAPHSTSSSTAKSDGRLVYTDANGCLFGIESVTGLPSWSRVIGIDTPFAPIEVETAVPGILAFDTTYNELILVSQLDGSLVWRLPFEGGELAKTPLIHESQIFLPTNQNNLYLIGLGTGRVSGKATFTQEVIAPPALAPDKSHIVIPGEEEVVYTLKTRPLECVDVAWMGQQAGTIKAPMIKMGNLLMMIENNEVEYSRLRVMKCNPDGTNLQISAEARVEGQVLDPAVLRGRELFVASNPQRITVFTINDQEGEEPIARVANNQLQDVEPTRMFLAARPGGELFLAGASLRKFQLRSNTLVIDQKETAEGIHLRDPVVIGKRLYMTRREPFAKSTYFTVADGDSMTSFWRLIVGSNVLAVAPQESGDITAVTDVGSAFRIKQNELAAGGFAIKPSAQDVGAKNLTSPMGATRLHDNRIAAYWGSPTPQIVILNERGQPLSQPLKLPAAPEATPVALVGGIVVPVPGGLQVVNPKRGARKVVDYRSPQVSGETSTWKSLTRLDDTQVVGIDSKNRMIQVQLRTPSGGQANLAEVRILDLEAAIDQTPMRHDKYLLTTDAAGQLSALDARSLEFLASVQMDVPASSPAYGVGDRIFVEAGGRETVCYGIGNTLEKTGRIQTNGVGLAGAPLAISNGYLVALQNGQLVMTDKDGNESGPRLELGVALQSGPIQAGNSIVVVGVNGSFLKIDQALAGG